MAYDSALNIISDAAAELGLGTVVDAYGSTDANIIQLRGLLKSAGRDLVRDRDWTHLIKEYNFFTIQNWKASTAYKSAVTPWQNSLSVTAGQFILNQTATAGGVYQCTTAGTTSGSGNGPLTTASGITDGTAVWAFANSGTANIVVQGNRQYKCAGSGTSGTKGPQYDLSDGGVTWADNGAAADYALPSDFSNMLDQTGWNRTNRLPTGGPVDGQTWQYLKGRQQGVVFNVLFRPVANLLRLYPDTDTPGGYNVVFEYVSSWWVSATGGTTPTTDAPTANTDIIYFDSLLMMRGLKLAWLKAKGFDATHAQAQYDQCFEESANADGSAPVLNLAGRGPFDPLVGVQNIPITGFGS